MSFKLFTDLSNLALKYQDKPFRATKNVAKLGHLIPIEIDEEKYSLELINDGEYDICIKKREYQTILA